MRRVICVLIVMCFLLSQLSACSVRNDNILPDGPKRANESDKLKIQKEKQIVIACIVNENDQYFKMLQLGMADAADKLGVKIFSANAYGKIDKEIELINTYIKSGVDGICIHPLSMELSIPVLNKAKENGIKVFSAGVSIKEEHKIQYIESDQWDLGKKTGEACKNFIETNLNGKANIAIINYKSLYSEESTKRTEGFKSEVTKLPGVKIVTDQEAWLSDTALSKATSIINSYPDLNIIWAANEGGTVGATIAVKNSRKAGKLFVFGTDVNEQILNMILDEDNILQAVTGQQPYDIGFQSINQLFNEINGEHSNIKTSIPDIPLSRSKPEDIKNFIS